MYCPLCAAEFEPGRARCPSCDAPVQSHPAPHSHPAGEAAPRGTPRAEWTPPPRMAPPGPNSPAQPVGPAPGARPGALPPGPGYSTATPRQGLPQPGGWWSAARCVGAAVGSVYVVGLGLVLLYAAVAGDLPGSALLTVPAAGAATAFGASWGLTLGGPDVGTLLGTGGNFSYDVRAYPLLLSALGLFVLAWRVRRGFAAGVSAATLTDRFTQAARVGLLLGGACLVLALLSRQSVGTGEVTASAGLALIAGMVVGALTVTVAGLCHDPGQAPPALRRLGAALAEPLVALRFTVPAVVLLGIVQLLVVLVFGQVDDDLTALGLNTNTSRSLGIAMLVPFAPNAAWLLFGVIVGAPLYLDTGIGIGGIRPTTMLDLAGGSGWWWLAPVAVFLVLFAAGTLLALRSPNAQVARQRVGVWSVTFGVASLGMGYLGGAALRLHGGFGNLHASVGNTLALVLVLSCAWALLAGLGAVALVARLSPRTRDRWAALVRPDPDTAHPDTPHGEPHRDTPHGEPHGDAPHGEPRRDNPYHDEPYGEPGPAGTQPAG